MGTKFSERGLARLDTNLSIIKAATNEVQRDTNETKEPSLIKEQTSQFVPLPQP